LPLVVVVPFGAVVPVSPLLTLVPLFLEFSVLVAEVPLPLEDVLTFAELLFLFSDEVVVPLPAEVSLLFVVAFVSELLLIEVPLVLMLSTPAIVSVARLFCTPKMLLCDFSLLQDMNMVAAVINTNNFFIFNDLIYMDKSLLLLHCEDMLLTRIEELKLTIKSLRSSSNNDTKSSMGDKYETSREMMQQDINRLDQQLAENNFMLFNLRAIKFKSDIVCVSLGNIVITSLGKFFIAVSLGEIHFMDEQIISISIASPLGKQLNGKKKGEFFSLNGIEQQILEVI
jgi:hypothetical protein